MFRWYQKFYFRRSEEDDVLKKLDAITDEEISISLLEQDIEEEAWKRLKTMTDDDIASHFNYTLICESPMEMSLNCQSNSFARGLFANIIMQYMKVQLAREFTEDIKKRSMQK